MPMGKFYVEHEEVCSRPIVRVTYQYNLGYKLIAWSFPAKCFFYRQGGSLKKMKLRIIFLKFSLCLYMKKDFELIKPLPF